MCLAFFLFGFILYGTLWDSWNWVAIYFPLLGKFSTIISSNIFSYLFFSSPGTPLIQMLVCLMLSQRSVRLFSFIFILFFQYSTMLQLFSTLNLPAYLSVLILIPVAYFLNFISVSMMFIVDFLFFISSRFLNVSCIFSIHASILYICASILFTRFWVIFTVITLNYFSGRFPIFSSSVLSGGFYHVPSSAACFSVFSFCLIYCIWGLLSTSCKVVVILVESTSSVWGWTWLEEGD